MDERSPPAGARPLDPEIQEMAASAVSAEPGPMSPEMAASAASAEPGPMSPEMARAVLGDDLTDEQFAWCAERLVAEAPGLVTEPVDLSPLRSEMPRTWVRTVHDIVVPAARQIEYAANVGNCPVVDLGAGHMCMVSQPARLAEILHEAAAT